MQDKEITDLITDLESVGLAPTTDEMLKDLKKDYEEKEKRIIGIKQHVWDNYSVKKTMTLKELEEALAEVSELRYKTVVKRDVWKTKFMREGQEKIEELSAILGKETGVHWVGSKKKSSPLKWYTEAISTLREQAERKTANSFWANSNDLANTIAKYIGELKKRQEESEAKSKLWEEFQWCKAKLISMGKVTEKTIESLSVTSVIELTHAILKEHHSIENGLTGEKCYCDTHDGNRHYHFTDSYWNGKEVVIYTTSETY
jgi:hypothetical protein